VEDAESVRLRRLARKHIPRPIFRYFLKANLIPLLKSDPGHENFRKMNFGRFSKLSFDGMPYIIIVIEGSLQLRLEWIHRHDNFVNILQKDGKAIHFKVRIDDLY